MALPAANPSASEQARDPERRARLSGQRVVVYDDEAPVRRILSRGLRRLGLEAQACGTVEGLWEALEAARTHAILLDATVPGQPGAHELVGPIREVWPEVALIRCSGQGWGELGESRELGFDADLSKPFGLDELRACLETALSD